MQKRLDGLIIAAPCPVSWDSMSGNDRVRLCAGCSKHVYNVSDMSSAEAEQFLSEVGTTVCMRFFRRSDGKIMSDNCPKGLRMLRNKCRLIFKLTAGIAASILALLPVGKNQIALAQEAKNNAAAQQSEDMKGDVAIRPLQGEPTSMTKVNPVTTRAVYGGKPMMNTPSNAHGCEIPVVNNKKTIMINGEGCQVKQTAPPTGQATDNLREGEAYKLYKQARANEEAGKLLLARTQYTAVLEIARMQKTKADPKFIQLVSEGLSRVNNRVSTVVRI